MSLEEKSAKDPIKKYAQDDLTLKIKSKAFALPNWWLKSQTDHLGQPVKHLNHVIIIFI